MILLDLLYSVLIQEIFHLFFHRREIKGKLFDKNVGSLNVSLQCMLVHEVVGKEGAGGVWPN